VPFEDTYVLKSHCSFVVHRQQRSRRKVGYAWCARYVDSGLFFIFDVSDYGIMGYDMVDVVICEQSDARETPLITYQSTWWHLTDDNILKHFREV